MKALRNGMLTIAALALAGSFAGTANAQAKAAGSFTLPFEAKWGNAVLPPGDYTFSVRSTSGAAYLVTFAAKGRSGATIISMKDLGEDWREERARRRAHRGTLQNQVAEP